MMLADDVVVMAILLPADGHGHHQTRQKACRA